MITFKEYLNELKFRNKKMNSKDVSIENSTLIYEGKEQKLLKNEHYFILIDNKNNVLFYIQYMEGANKQIILGSRENVSDKKELFFRVIYTLLFLGYQIREDYQHNEKSLKSILKIIKSNHLIVKYAGKDITQDLIDNNFNDDTYDTFTYEIRNRDSQHLIERYLKWEGEDLFDAADDFVKTTLKD